MKRGVKRRVVDEEQGRMFDKVIEFMYVTSGYLCSMLGPLGVFEERSETLIVTVQFSNTAVRCQFQTTVMRYQFWVTPAVEGQSLER